MPAVEGVAAECTTGNGLAQRHGTSRRATRRRHPSGSGGRLAGLDPPLATLRQSRASRPIAPPASILRWARHGTMTIADGAMVPLGGTIDNSGTIALASTSDGATVEVQVSGVTLQGGGKVLLSDDGRNFVTAGDPSGSCRQHHLGRRPAPCRAIDPRQ
jgi:hypothetical protein